VPISALVARAEGEARPSWIPTLVTVGRLRRSVLVKLGIAVAILAVTAVPIPTTPARPAEPTVGKPVEAGIGYANHRRARPSGPRVCVVPSTRDGDD
jgi:hypothetical protein